MFIECSPCCLRNCTVIDGKPSTDPKNEGTWVPSGKWRSGSGSADEIVWDFIPNPGDESGNTWFFFGSRLTSAAGGRATVAEQQDYGNLCNWYSSKINTPYSSGAAQFFDKRANRLPPSDAIIHVYSNLSTVLTGPVTVRSAYFWSGEFLQNSILTATAPAHDSPDGGSVVFSLNRGTLNGGATFNNPAGNVATVNGVATFNSRGNDFPFFSAFNTGTVNGNAIFYDNSLNWSSFGPTNGLVNGFATFNDNSINEGIVNAGAVFNDNAIHWGTATVNGGATFNDAACSRQAIGSFYAVPCTRKFVAHPTDLPTCNGTAPNGCFTPPADCGCG